MDPHANIEEQRTLARKIIADYEADRGQYGESGAVLDEDAHRLAELVLALDEWRAKGGFDPYTAPRYVHDCGQCVFVGQHERADVYVCPQAGHPTVVMRMSAAGGDYTSGASLIDRLPAELHERASRLISQF